MDVEIYGEPLEAFPRGTLARTQKALDESLTLQGRHEWRVRELESQLARVIALRVEWRKYSATLDERRQRGEPSDSIERAWLVAHEDAVDVALGIITR